MIRGTLQEFTDWHEQVKILEGLPRIGYVNGIPAPQNQWTTEYSTPIQNPNGSDDYVWETGDYQNDNENVNLKDLNWFLDEAL